MVMTELPPLARLVHAARGGDGRAFGELVERFQHMAQGYALSLLRDPGLAEDACQEAFVDAFLHLNQLREDAAFPGWFRRVVHKHADRQRRSRLLAIELGELPGARDPLAALLEAEERRSVQEEVAALPARLRDSIALFYGAGLTVDEMASFLNVTPSAVKKRLFDARALLRRALPCQSRPDPGRATPLRCSSPHGPATRESPPMFWRGARISRPLPNAGLIRTKSATTAQSAPGTRSSSGLSSWATARSWRCWCARVHRYTRGWGSTRSTSPSYRTTSKWRDCSLRVAPLRAALGRGR